MSQHPNPLIPTSSEKYVTDLKEFMGRPRICPSGNVTWTTSSVKAATLMSMSLPEPMINTGIWAGKVDNIYGFKATTVIRIQANAQQFQAGILLIRYIPAYGHIDPARRAIIESDLRYMSQLPSVRMNIAETDEVVLKVPFISPELFFNRTSPIAWGQVYVTVYSPLSADNVSLTCWCHFEDIEFTLPTAQSGRLQNVSRRKVRRDPSDQEVPSGLVSGPLSTIALGIGQFGRNIPTISSVTAPLEWFTNACSKVASAFGFSTPIDPSTRSSIVRRIFSHAWNSDAAETCDSMALTLSNKISHMPGFAGMDLDEMSIQYIAGIPSYIGGFGWADTQTAGTLLWGINVQPLNTNTLFSKSIATTTIPTTVYVPTPYAYLATMFQSWRGSIIYKFYAAKSMFHVGRILIAFKPFTGGTTLTLADAEATYRWIWDIRDSFEFEVTIPYTSSVPWRSTDFSTTISSTGSLFVYVLNDLTAPATTVSTIEILVETRAGPDFELAAPIFGSSNYTPIIAYSGPLLEGNSVHSTRKQGSRRRVREISSQHDPTSDASVNPSILNRKHRHRLRPHEIDLTVFRNSSKLKSHLVRDQARSLKYETIFAQSGDVVTLAHLNEPAPGPPTDKDIESLNSLYTMGESIKSLRQILKRASQYCRSGFTAGTLHGVQLEPSFPILRYAIAGTAAVLDLSAVNAANIYYTDTWSRIAPLYALFRGSMIHKCASTGVTTDIFFKLFNQINNIPPLYGANSTTWTAASIAGENMVHQYSPSSSQNAVDALVPFYGQAQSYPVGYYNQAQFGTLTYGTNNLYYRNHHRLVITANIQAAVPTVTKTYCYRSIADDMSLGCFLGTMPLYIAPYTTLG